MPPGEGAAAVVPAGAGAAVAVNRGFNAQTAVATTRRRTSRLGGRPGGTAHGRRGGRPEAQRARAGRGRNPRGCRGEGAPDPLGAGAPTVPNSRRSSDALPPLPGPRFSDREAADLEPRRSADSGVRPGRLPRPDLPVRPGTLRPVRAGRRPAGSPGARGRGSPSRSAPEAAAAGLGNSAPPPAPAGTQAEPNSRPRCPRRRHPARIVYPAAGIDVVVHPLDPSPAEIASQTIVPPVSFDGYWVTNFGMPGAGSANTTYIMGHSWEGRDAPFNRLSSATAPGTFST